MYKALEKFVKANDDWYPNYEGNMVKVRASYTYNETVEDGTFPGGVKIFIAGMDDDTMEIEWSTNYARKEDLDFIWEVTEGIFNEIPELVNHHLLAELGFVRG